MGAIFLRLGKEVEEIHAEFFESWEAVFAAAFNPLFDAGVQVVEALKGDRNE